MLVYYKRILWPCCVTAWWDQIDRLRCCFYYPWSSNNAPKFRKFSVCGFNTASVGWVRFYSFDFLNIQKRISLLRAIFAKLRNCTKAFIMINHILMWIWQFKAFSRNNVYFCLWLKFDKIKKLIDQPWQLSNLLRHDCLKANLITKLLH